MTGNVFFLCGEEMLVDWKATVHFSRKRMTFGGGGDSIKLIKGSHLGMRLEQDKDDGGPGYQGRSGGYG